MDDKIPPACAGCVKEDPQISLCRIRTYQFAIFSKPCPRERPADKLDIDVLIPQKEPQQVSKLPKNTRAINEDVLSTNLRIEELEPGVFSPRKQFSPAYIDELAESIKREGQHKPIVVRLHPSDSSRYQIVDGECRVRAIQKLGRSMIRAEVRVLGDQEADVLAMAINEMHGKRLNRLEEGLHLQKLMEKYGWTQEQVGKVFNRGQGWVNDRVLIAKRANPELIDSFSTRVLNFSKAREIVELPPEDQPDVIKKVVEDKLSARNTETLVHAIKEAKTPEDKQRVLQKPIALYTSIVKTPEELKRVLEQAPSEAVWQLFECEQCHATYSVDWVARKITRAPRRITPNG